MFDMDEFVRQVNEGNFLEALERLEEEEFHDDTACAVQDALFVALEQAGAFGADRDIRATRHLARALQSSVGGCTSCSSARRTSGGLYCQLWDEPAREPSDTCAAWDPAVPCAWEGCPERAVELVGGVHLCAKHARALCAELAGDLAEMCPYPEDVFGDAVGKAARTGWSAALHKLQEMFEEVGG